MRKKIYLALIMISFSFAHCSTTSRIKDQIKPTKALIELKKGNFKKAEAEASLLINDHDNCTAYLIRAASRYVIITQELNAFIRNQVLTSIGRNNYDYNSFYNTLTYVDKKLNDVEKDLEKASECQDINLDLCLANWKIDWNLDGDIDSDDQRLLEVETDVNGDELPENDPRRKPVFRIDFGDVLWAQAYVNFQRAALNIILAYNWEDLDSILKARRMPQYIKIRLKDSNHISNAKEYIFNGLDLSAKARLAYLNEKDDEREWLPNPKQKSYFMPLPVTEELYTTWDNVLKDSKQLFRGKDGINFGEVAELLDLRLPSKPQGYLNIGKMFSEPKDIEIDVRELIFAVQSKNPELVLKSLFGKFYVNNMNSTPLLKRMARMNKEIMAGMETFDQKLKYLFWIN